MKTVYPSRELGHLWAHATQPNARNGTNSVHFEGDAFYSYQTVIARRLTYRGRLGFVIDRASFSNTTSKHQGFAYGAVHGDGLFNVQLGKRYQDLNFTPQTLQAHYLAEHKRLWLSRNEPRMVAKKAERTIEAMRQLEEAIRVGTYFGIAKANLEKLHASLYPGYTTALGVVRAYRATLEQRDRLRKANASGKLAAARLAQAQAFLADETGAYLHGHRTWLLPQDIAERVDAKIARLDASRIADWQSGRMVDPRSHWPTLLRLDPLTPSDAPGIETSKHARFSLADGHKAYRFAKAMRAKGWHRNGEQFAIGNYQLDAVNDFGVIAGCHRIAWAELERFAKVAGWEVAS